MRKNKLAIFLASLIAIMCSVSLILLASQTQSDVYIRSDYDAINFLKTLGYDAELEPISVDTLLIPMVFDNIYSDYNKMQKKSGFDFEKYKGKQVQKRTYYIKNHIRSGDLEVIANLFIFEDKLIGGDIMSPSIYGFISPLR